MNDQEFDAYLRNNINKVKNSSASSSQKLAQTWNQIETKLAHEQRSRTTTFSFAIAASVSLLCIVAIYTGRFIFSNEKLSYKQETISESNNSDLTNDDSSFEKEILSMLEHKCQIKKTTCDSEEFHQLKVQLNALDEKEKEIQTELRIYGQVPSVLKAQTKIRIMKADVLKKLLKI